jgi:Fe-Mn family superoxide dismutase
MGEAYKLPELAYAYNALQPNISENQLKLHHQKHHQAYVDGANSILAQLEAARKENKDIDIKAALKALSFNIAGHILHSLFWANMQPAKADNKPTGKIASEIEKEFGSFERFKKEFSQAAITAEGSGWAALSYCKKTSRLIIMQIEKHNVNVIPNFAILLVLDVWEHAYYLDYQNLRAKFVENFWNVVNWDEVNKRLEKIA